MACMGNFQAYNWTSEPNTWKPAPENEPAATGRQYDDACEGNSQVEVRPCGRKTWTESSLMKPMCVEDSEMPQFVPHNLSYDQQKNDNVKSLLRYDADSAREWPYCPSNNMPKIGQPFQMSDKQLLQIGDPHGPEIVPRRGCHMTKFVNEMNKTYKLFKLYGQTSLGLPL